MYIIRTKKELAQDTILMDVEAPRIAKSALPGQFLIVKIIEKIFIKLAILLDKHSFMCYNLYDYSNI